MLSVISRSIVFLVWVFALAARTLAGTQYSLTDFGSNTYNPGINALGQVIVNFNSGAYLWTPNTPNGTSGSFAPLNIPTAMGINDYGQVVGTDEGFGGGSHAYLWTPTTPNGTTGSAVDLIAGTGDPYGYVEHINAYGQAIVARGTEPADSLTYLWTPTAPNGSTGSMVEQGAIDINNSAQIVTYLTADPLRTAVWKPTTPNGSTGSEFDIGHLDIAPSVHTDGHTINDHGQIAGSDYVEVQGAYGNPTLRGFVWTPDTDNGTTGSMIDLGLFPGSKGWVYPNGVNNHGVVVGADGVFSDTRGFVWTPADGMLNLNTLLDASGAGFTVMYAYDINDAGQIAAYAHFAGDGPINNEIYRAVLLTPVPEPGAVGVFLTSGLSLCVRRRARLFRKPVTE